MSLDTNEAFKLFYLILIFDTIGNLFNSVVEVGYSFYQMMVFKHILIKCFLKQGITKIDGVYPAYVFLCPLCVTVYKAMSCKQGNNLLLNGLEILFYIISHPDEFLNGIIFFCWNIDSPVASITHALGNLSCIPHIVLELLAALFHAHGSRGQYYTLVSGIHNIFIEGIAKASCLIAKCYIKVIILHLILKVAYHLKQRFNIWRDGALVVNDVFIKQFWFHYAYCVICSMDI